jgi:hypothetical protein
VDDAGAIICRRLASRNTDEPVAKIVQCGEPNQFRGIEHSAHSATLALRGPRSAGCASRVRVEGLLARFPVYTSGA